MTDSTFLFSDPELFIDGESLIGKIIEIKFDLRPEDEEVIEGTGREISQEPKQLSKGEA